MSETDAEFVADMEWLHSHDREAALPPEKLARLFTLARRGAEMQTVGHLDDGKTAILRAAGLHQTSAKILEQAEEIRTLRAALRECDAVPLPPEVRAVVRAALGGEHEP